MTRIDRFNGKLAPATLVVLGCFAAALLPLLLTRFPPIMDYPNHLARIWLLAGGADDPALAGAYIVDWGRAATNVAVDWLAAKAASLVSLGLVDRALRVLMILGPAVATALLARRVRGQLSVWHTAPLVFVWGTTSIAGFLNYNVSLGLALLGAYLFAIVQPRALGFRLGLHVLSAFLLLTVHPFGYLFYVLLVSGLIVGPQWFRPLSAEARPKLVEVAGFGALAAIPLLMLSRMSGSPPRTDGISFPSLWDMANPLSIAKTLLSPVLGYDQLVDLILFLPFALCVGLCAWTQRVRVHFGLALAVALLAVGSLAAPLEIGDASWLNRRLPLMLALTACVAFQPEIEASRQRAWLTALLLLSVLGKIAWSGFVWRERDSDLAELMLATRPVAAGDPVIVLYATPGSAEAAPLGRYMVGAPGGTRPVRRHLASLLVPYRSAFVPTLFAIEGQHPLRIAPRFGATTAAIHSTDQWQDQRALPTYLQDWPCRFRYVLLLGADEAPGLSLRSPDLSPLNDHGFAALYTVQQRPGRCARADP